MSCLCIGGVCIPYSAVFTLFLIGLKWFGAKIFSLGLLPESVAARLGIGKSTSSCVGKSCCAIKSSIDRNKVGKVHVIEDEEDWESIKKKETIIIAKFTATWCKPCKEIEPFFRSIAGNYPDVFFCSLDVDEFDDAAAECGVTIMPTFCALKNGKKVNSAVGANESNLERFVEENCRKMN